MNCCGVLKFRYFTMWLIWFSLNVSHAQGSAMQELSVGMDTPPKSMDPRLIGADANSQYLEELRFLPLVSFSPSGAVRFVAAQSITPISSQAFLVTLRKGLKFASGGEMTADDVIATYQSLTAGLANFPPSPRKGAFGSLKKISKRDQYSVEFQLSQPDAAFLVNLVIGILPKEAANGKPEDTLGKGYESGPYILKNATAREWLLERNPAFGSVAEVGSIPKVAKVKFKFIADNTTRFAALMKGDLDIVQNGIDADKLIEIQNKHSQKFRITNSTSTSTTSLVFNLKAKPFENKLVRKAIAEAINRDEIIQFILQGFAKKANSMFPEEFAYHFKAPEILHSVQNAKTLLDQAGLKDPDGDGPATRFTFTIKVPTNKERIAVAKAIAAQLKKVGIAAQVESLEFGTFNKQISDGVAQAWIAPWTGYKDPDHLRFCFHSGQIPPLGGNRGRYTNPKVDELLAAGQKEPHIEKRLPLYSEAQRILAEDTPYVYLWYKLNTVVTAKNVSGYQLYSDGRYLSLADVTKSGAN